MYKIFKVKKGDEFGFNVTFKNITKEPKDILFGLKVNVAQPNYDLILSLSEGQIRKIKDYQYSIVLDGKTTDRLGLKNYNFDLRFMIDESVKTPFSGKLILTETVFN